MGQTKSFGEWLRHRRREIDLTQEELARQVGCAPITVRKIEADQTHPSKQLAELLIEQLGVAPEQREDFVRFARGGEPAEPAAITAPKHNLPHRISSFIGREREIADIERLLSTSRLVTLTGVGGCGKTRLALEVARGLVNAIEDGVWWVELAALAIDSLVPQAIARTFGLREAPNQETSEILLNYLRDRRLLLVIDNCEHLIKSCAELSERLLKECPNLGILTTSREPLSVIGEAVYQVSPLSLPDANETSPVFVLQSEAARMFLERTQAVKPDFALTEQNATAVVRICRRLDGIPLALELASARVKLLTVEHIAERLHDRFSLLTTGSRTALPRQQTLRATIDWSYDLLSEKTKTLFRRLSVFAGGFSLSATEAVCSDEQLAKSEVLSELSRLVDRSLVEVMQRGDEERYRMLETIRMYAREKLQESGEEAHFRDWHLKFFMEWAEGVEPKLRGPDQIFWWDQMEMEHNNIRAALERSLSGRDVQMGLRLAVATVWFWKPRSYWREGLRWLKDTLAKTPTDQRTSARAKALVVSGYLAMEMYTTDPVNEWYEEGLGILREVGDTWWVSYALLLMGWHHMLGNDVTSAQSLFDDAVSFAREARDAWILGCALRSLGAAIERINYEAARPILEESLLYTQTAGDRWVSADVLKQLGTLALGLRDYNWAASIAGESVKLFGETGDREFRSESLMILARALLGQGDVKSARRFFEESLALAESVGYKAEIGNDLIYFGCVAEKEGQPRCAAVLLAAGESVLNSIGTTVANWPWSFRDYEHCMARVKVQLGEAESNKAMAEGQAMNLDDAVKYALEGSVDD